MSDTFGKAYCYFQTSDNSDGTFWIYASPQEPFTFAGHPVAIGLDLQPGTSMKEADELSALLRKYVTHVHISS